MNDDTRHTLHASARVLQDIELGPEDVEVMLPTVSKGLMAVSKLAPRIAFEDEPALYVPFIERAKG